jgi:hypothetical protein
MMSKPACCRASTNAVAINRAYWACAQDNLDCAGHGDGKTAPSRSASESSATPLHRRRDEEGPQPLARWTISTSLATLAASASRELWKSSEAVVSGARGQTLVIAQSAS